jgi:hypothetical protein
VKVACREDVTRGKLWAYGDPHEPLSKRKKDELDLIRLAEGYPELKSQYPTELREQLDRDLHGKQEPPGGKIASITRRL